MKKKRVLALVLALSMMTGLLTGCGNSSSDDSGSTDGTTSESSNGEVDDTLVVLGSNTVETFDPLNTGLNYKTHYLQIFDTLVRYEEDGSVGPHIAESFEETEDGTGYIFYLRDDVDFTDGTHLDAEAVKFAVDTVTGGEYSSWTSAYIGEAEVVDEYTVIIYKAASYTKLLEFLADYLYIVSPTAYQADPDGFATNPVGSGPYLFEKVGADGYLYLTANENYFNGEPYFKNVVIRTELDSSTATVALQNGEIDIVSILPAEQIALIQDDPNITIATCEGWSVKSVFLQGSNFTSDENLRKAIYYAINRENAIIFDSAPEGTEVATNMFSTRMMGDYSNFMDIGGYDVDLALEYLAKSDYDGSALKITITSDQANIAQSIQEDLKAVGITTEIVQLDANAWSASFVDGSCDMVIVSWGVSYASLEEQMGFHSGNGYYANIVYNTEEFDQLLLDMADIWVEADREEMCKEALTMTFDFANMVPLYEDTFSGAYNSSLTGFEDIWLSTFCFYLDRVGVE